MKSRPRQSLLPLFAVVALFSALAPPAHRAEETRKGKTDAKGQIEEEIPLKAKKAKLSLRVPPDSAERTHARGRQEEAARSGNGATQTVRSAGPCSGFPDFPTTDVERCCRLLMVGFSRSHL